MERIEVPNVGIFSTIKYVKPLSKSFRVCVKTIKITAINLIISIPGFILAFSTSRSLFLQVC